MTEGASKPSCRLCAYVERKLGKLKDGIHKKVDNLRWYSFGHYEHPDSYYDVGSFPVPTSPTQNNFDYNINAPGPFPEPAPPQGWRPQNLEASGSNHTSNPNSSCFDGVNPEEYRLQHQIPNYEDFQANHSLGDQLAGLLQNDLLLDTPTSHDHRQPEFDPVEEYINDPEKVLWSDFRDQHQTANNTTFQTYGSMMDDQHQTENNTTVQYGSMMTADTGESRESMMDTGASNCKSLYILDPVAEEAPPTSVMVRRKFYDFYVDVRRIARGEPEGARGASSGRRGRGFRVMGRILCIAIRLKGRRILQRMRKRTYCQEPGQNRGQCWRQQCARKRIRTGGSVISDQSRSTGYKGIMYRNGRWNAEIRVSKTRTDKVWLGTFDTEVHAALAADAGMHHCSGKKKKFNFPTLVEYLGPSQYQAVHALCLAGRKDEAKATVTRLADTHANTFAPSLLHH